MKVKQLETDNRLFNILYQLLEYSGNNRSISYSVKMYSTSYGTSFNNRCNKRYVVKLYID